MVLVVLLACAVVCLCFFFKQKTAYEMRISDWSSDVCSSDLVAVGEPFRFGGDRAEQVDQRFRLALVIAAQDMAGHAVLVPRMADADAYAAEIQIGRASCRERVCQYV